MEYLLTRVTQQAMNYAIRSGIAVTSGYAISQCSRLLKSKDGDEKERIESLRRRLESKIRIISPAIDMIELITARGNTSLESAVSLTKILRWEIQNLGVRLASAAADEELSQNGSKQAKSKAERDQNLDIIISDMKSLLAKIEDAVPLINLAITTSGVSLTTSLPASVSPSRLMQASTFLSTADARFVNGLASAAQVGPTFTLSMYMLFASHAHRPQDEEDLRSTTWKEVIHKARVKLIRTSVENVKQFHEPTRSYDRSSYGETRTQITADVDSKIPAVARADEFAYQLLFLEDLDDGRVHTFEDDESQPESFDDVQQAGIRDIVPIHEISKIFYADTGKILNIGNSDDTNNPVLLLKRDVNAIPPRRMMETSQYWTDSDEALNSNAISDEAKTGVDESSELAAQFEREMFSSPAHAQLRKWRLPSGLDPEWIALEVYVQDTASDDESDSLEDDTFNPASQQNKSSRENSIDHEIAPALGHLRLSSPHSNSVGIHELTSEPEQQLKAPDGDFSSPAITGVRTSLSLLEMLIRLTSLQQFQQVSHLTISDELLNFFLEESSTTGVASGDADARKRIRMQARQRVGFDPYDESPIKRRGEQLQYNESVSGRQGNESSFSLYEESPRQGHTESSPLPAREHQSFSKAHSSPPRGTIPSNAASQRNEVKYKFSTRTSEARRGDKMSNSPLGRTSVPSSPPGDIDNGFPSARE